MAHYYKRGWEHTKQRGQERSVNCGFCGRKVPKYKTFPVIRGLRINDPVIKAEMGFRHGLSLMQTKVYACPGCARYQRIVRKKR